jgi:hypothetical protein
MCKLKIFVITNTCKLIFITFVIIWLDLWFTDIDAYILHEKQSFSQKASTYANKVSNGEPLVQKSLQHKANIKHVNLVFMRYVFLYLIILFTIKNIYVKVQFEAETIFDG